MSNVVLRIESAVAAGVEGVRKFKTEVRETQVATADLRETYVKTARDFVASTREEISAQTRKVEAMRNELVAIREVSTSYKRGSEERILAAKMEIETQRKLQAALGETAAVAGKTGKESSARAEESGLLRGAASRSGVAGTGMAALAGPGFIAGAVVGGVLDYGVKAAKDEEVAQANLRNALKATGNGRAELLRKTNEYTSAEEHLTGFTRDQVVQSMSMLLRATGSLTKARQDEAVMANVARARQTDLSGAYMLVVKASEGNVGALRRLGIDVQKTTTYEDKLKEAHLSGNIALEKRAKAMDLAATRTEVMRTVTQKFAGDSTAYMGTFAGRTAELHNEIHDLAVEIGEKAIPVLDRLFGWIDKELKAARESTTVHKALHDVVVILKDLWGGLTTAVQAAEALWRTKVGRTIEIVTGAIWLMNAALDANPFLAIAAVALIAVGEIRKHWDGITGFFDKLWGYIDSTGRAAWALIVDLAKAAVYAIMEYATAGIQGILEVASHLPFVGHKARAALDDIQGYIAKWKPDFSNVVTAFNKGGQAAGDAFQLSVQTGMQAALSGATATGGVGAATGGSPNRAGTTGGGQENIVAGGNPLQKGLVQTAQSALGNPYSYGGAPSISSPTDCSGLMVAVFSQHGINLPRTSEEQFASAPIKNARPLAPGDLVFTEGVHPGHVGLYIGNGQVLEDPHTGDHVKIVSLSGFGWNGESARWWAAAAKPTPHGATTKPPAAAVDNSAFDSAVSAASSAAAAAKAAKGGLKAPSLIGLQGMIDAELAAIPKGQLDEIEKAAIAHIKQIRDSLHVGMPASELAKDKVELARWGKNLKDEIKKNSDDAKKAVAEHKKELAKAAADARKAWEAGWTADVSDIGRRVSEQWASVQQTFDRETSAHVTQMQRGFQAQMTTFDRDTQAQMTTMQRAFAAQMATFDRETQKGLDALNIAQTPEEQAYNDFVAKRAADDQTARLTGLKKTLSDAQAALTQAGNPLATGGGGVVGNTALLTPNGWVYQSDSGTPTVQGGQDLASLQQAVVDAQKALDGELSDEHESALQAAADASRKAADKQTQIQQDAYQSDRDAQKQALQDAEDLNEQAYQDDRDARKQHLQDLEDADEQSYNDRRATQWQALSDLHDDQVAAFDDDLKLWQTALEGKQKTWGQFLAWLQANPISKGINGGAITDPTQNKIPTIADLTGGTVAATLRTGKMIAEAAGGLTVRPHEALRGEQGPEVTIPLTSQHGVAIMRQLVQAALAAGGGAGPGGGGGTTIYGTFLGATERQVGRALEGLVTPQQGRVVRYPAPL